MGRGRLLGADHRALANSDTVLSPLPLFHSYALNLSVLGILATGASEYIMEKFSTSEAVRLLKTGEFTYFPGVPTMFHYLLQATRGENDLRFPNLRLCVSAGAIMPATLNREFEERFGMPLLDGYGITETSTMVTMNWPTGGRVARLLRASAAGPCRAHRRSGERHATLQPGQEGELIVRGPNVMPGYHNKPEETAQRAARRLVSHRRPRQERRERLPHHHRTAEGAHHPRRPEHRAGRDRGGGEHLRGRARLRRGRRAARASRRGSGAVRGGAAGPDGRNRGAARRIAARIFRPTRFRTRCT